MLVTACAPLLLAAWLAQPAALPPPGPAAAPAPAPAPTAEKSVRPDANRRYRETEVDEWIKRFESAGREIFDQRQAIVAASGARPGMQVADVGAGTGLLSLLLARAVAPTGRVYAIDIIPKFLAHLDQEKARQHVDNVITRLGDERSVPLPDESVDLLFLCDAYHHFEYPRSMNRSMWKALRPGGTLVLIDYRRIPGKTPKNVLEHVRAGEEVFSAELIAAGFEKLAPTSPLPGLKENYLIRFRKPGRPKAP
jgi:ubiquinone/menaquinone biosynthesis C-methylase UbiE